MANRRPVRTATFFLTIVALALTSAPAHGQEERDGFFKRLRGLIPEQSLPEDRIREGLREALSVGIDKTVKLVGREDGYFKNKDIRIPLPKPLQRVDGGLRAVGFGQKVDEFVLSMNRAAEAAAPLAKDVFIDAISRMEIDDARRILEGRDTEATDYLKKHTSVKLTEEFTPIMREKMAEYGVVQQFGAIEDKYAGVSFLRRSLKVDAEEYAVEKALEGLFYVLGQEERKIRTDPAARTTALLKEIFGGT